MELLIVGGGRMGEALLGGLLAFGRQPGLRTAERVLQLFHGQGFKDARAIGAVSAGPARVSLA